MHFLRLKNLLILFALITFKVSGQIVSFGEEQTIYSNSLKEERTYWVRLPEDYTDTTYAPYSYPVLYFLDADRHFQSVSAIVEFLSEGPYAAIPDLILVGILNTDRARDLTPTEVKEKQFGKFSFPNTGGHKNFQKFITTELMPQINSNYRTNGYNIYMGHSFGGLSSINTLLENQAPFNAYLAFDPSVWWDNRYLCEKGTKVLPKIDWDKKALYLTEAFNFKIPSDTSTEHERAIQHFAKILDDTEPKNLRWKYEYYPTDDHGNISLPATYYGLKFVFDGYQQEVKLMFDEPEKLLEHYNAFSEKAGFKFVPTEWMIDWMLDYCQHIQKPESAKKFAEMNVRLYPNSEHAKKQLEKLR